MRKGPNACLTVEIAEGMRLWIHLVGWRWKVKYKITENFAPKFYFYIDGKKVILIGLSISWCLMGDFFADFL